MRTYFNWIFFEIQVFTQDNVGEHVSQMLPILSQPQCANPFAEIISENGNVYFCFLRFLKIGVAQVVVCLPHGNKDQFYLSIKYGVSFMSFIQTLICIRLSYCNDMQYHVIEDRVVMVPDYTELCGHNAFNFFQNSHNKHPIHQFTREGEMGCILWVRTDLFSLTITAVLWAISWYGTVKSLI